MELKVKKQSLYDWSVENDKGVTLAWIESKKDKRFGKSFSFYEVRYTSNLGYGADALSHDITQSFKEAKEAATKTIEFWLSN